MRALGGRRFTQDSALMVPNQADQAMIPLLELGEYRAKATVRHMLRDQPLEQRAPLDLELVRALPIARVDRVLYTIGEFQNDAKLRVHRSSPAGRGNAIPAELDLAQQCNDFFQEIRAVLELRFQQCA